jgi:hypoxanthine phosphoribosyltransferase
MSFMPSSTGKQPKCEILSWNSVARDSKELSDAIKASGYKPSIVIAIARGGLVPARILCDYLHIKDLTTIKVEHWGITATPDKKAVLRFPLCTDIKGKKVLLVDDITDTGDTLRVSTEYLKDLAPQDLKTAVLLHKTVSEFVPDYYVKKITKWRWVIFPWHIWEDLSNFVKEIRTDGIYSAEEICDELKNRYSIDARIEMIREMLSEP